MQLIIQLLFYLGARGPLAIFVGAWLFFALLYFSTATISTFLTRFVFPAVHLGQRIDNRPLKIGQIQFEILHSLLSITIFAAYGVLQFFFYRWKFVSVSWETTAPRWFVETVFLFFWNEFHFYVCHRILHTRWLFAKVHRIHHHSVVPTPFSTFSFHWAEAALLGSVMVLAMAMHEFSFHSLFMLPLLSIVANGIGHSNYSFTSAEQGKAASVSFDHALHHHRAFGNFGFLIPWFDQLFGTKLSVTQEVPLR